MGGWVARGKGGRPSCGSFQRPIDPVMGRLGPKPTHAWVAPRLRHDRHGGLGNKGRAAPCAAFVLELLEPFWIVATSASRLCRSPGGPGPGGRRPSCGSLLGPADPWMGHSGSKSTHAWVSPATRCRNRPTGGSGQLEVYFVRCPPGPRSHPASGLPAHRDGSLPRTALLVFPGSVGYVRGA